jgi:hypothetical protein
MRCKWILAASNGAAQTGLTKRCRSSLGWHFQPENYPQFDSGLKNGERNVSRVVVIAKIKPKISA